MATESATTAPPNVTKDSAVTLHEINKDNWRAVIELSVLEGQQGNVSPNVKSLCEAHYSEDAWWYAIWRFMIDQRYQRLGFGKATVKLAIEHVRKNHPHGKLMHLMSTGPDGKSDVPAEHPPYKIYTSLGFAKTTGEDENGQFEMGLDL